VLNAQISPLLNSFSKSLSKSRGPKKQPTTNNETTSKGKSIATGLGIISPSGLNLSLTWKRLFSHLGLSMGRVRGGIGGIRPRPVYPRGYHTRPIYPRVQKVGFHTPDPLYLRVHTRLLRPITKEKNKIHKQKHMKRGGNFCKKKESMLKPGVRLRP